MYKEIYGDLIELAYQAKFDVIVHGCNCYCTMNSGIAVLMKYYFGCDTFPLEKFATSGDINKLGQIDWGSMDIKITNTNDYFNLTVVNAYTQFRFDKSLKPIDYEALALCLRKINYIFAGKHIGLPKIGAGLAGGDWEIIKKIIIKEFTHCDVTVVIYDK